MVRHHALVSAILIGLCLHCASPVSAQSSTQQSPQRQFEPIIPPEWKPDLVVTSAKATTVCTAQGTVTAKIVATIKNQSPKGTADLSNIPWRIIVEANWSSTTGPNNLENRENRQSSRSSVGPKR